MTSEAAATPAPAEEPKKVTYGDLSREADAIQARLMKCSKECLGLAFSALIADRAFLYHGADAAGRATYAEKEIANVERWKKLARATNQNKRAKAFLDSLRNPKPRRRRRRKRRAA